MGTHTKIVIGILSLCVSACSDSKFKAQAPTPESQPSQNAQPQPYPQPVLPPSDQICQNRSEFDPDETFSFTSRREIAKFVNSLGGVPIITSAAFSGDPISAKWLCNRKGYREAANVRPGKFHSCGDNMIVYVNGQSLIPVNACMRNQTLDGVDCMGKDVQVDCHGNRLGKTNDEDEAPN